MKHLIAFCLILSIILTACGTSPANTPVPVAQTTEPAPVAEAETSTPLPTDTPPAATPTLAPTQQPSRTPSAPETCPQTDAKLRAQFGSLFREKNVPYHDGRQTLLDFLNAGGDPQTAIAKLAENGVNASLLDVTFDGVPEFFLRSGYLTVFGCRGGAYQTLLDIAPSEESGHHAVPLVIQDLNQNGTAEMLIAQVQDFRVKYVIIEWDGAAFAPLTVEKFGNIGKLFIDNHNIYAVGQSREEEGVINGNWQVADTNGDGMKEISIKAGINASFSSQNLEEQMTLAWDGTAYAVVSKTIEPTPIPTQPPTSIPTFTPVPFSSTCDFQVSDVWYYPTSGDSDRKQSVENFLNAGGNPEKLQPYFETKILDLTNDGVKDVLISADTGYVYIFKCVNGIYQQQLDFPFDENTYVLNLATVQDINKNGIPEIFVKNTSCFDIKNLDCGVLYIAEWDVKSNSFKGLIKDQDGAKQLDYAITNHRQETYLKDFDGDNIFEMVWVGGVPGQYDDQSGLPWRLETHIYKWDGQYYSPQLVEYSSPIYRFQAVQDGDRYALDGQLEKALKSYKNAIENDLGWWKEARRDYLSSLNGEGPPCAGEGTRCPLPTLDPNEKPILQAYATYRIMLTQILLNQADAAKATYEGLLSSHPSGDVAYPITEMATTFWQEYQASKNIRDACFEAQMYVQSHNAFLAYIGSNYHGWQMNTYEPFDICPFK